MLNKDLKNVPHNPKEEAETTLPKGKDEPEGLLEALAAFLVAGAAWAVIIILLATYKVIWG